MISIIISTYQPQYLEAVKQNIAETIGVPFEIIAIENKRAMGICKAYNMGAEKAKFPYLCFAHEDIEFKTRNWANSLITKFEADDQTGLIGVAGTTYKSFSPGGWGNISKETDRLHIIQHYKDNREPEYCSQITKDFEQVVCVDGVFLFTKRSIYLENKFDEKTFTNFHCYDLDFSLNINQTKKVFVTNQVLIEHFSPGGMNEVWIDETIKLSKKWNNFFLVGSLKKSIQKEIEWKHKYWTVSKMISFEKPLIQILKIYLGYGFFRFFSAKEAYRIFRIITKSVLT